MLSATRFTTSVLGIFFLIAASAQARQNVYFVAKDQYGTPLSDVVIEPENGAIISEISNKPAIIDQINKRFKPEQLLINKGEQVMFPNSDNIRHHVYSFSKAKTFELKLYADIPENPVSFNEHGVVVLGCNIHDTMIGYIFVSNSAETVMTGVNGQATLINQEPIASVNIWHKHQMSGPETLTNITLDKVPKNTSGQYLLTIETQPPKPTNSFEDTFGGSAKD